jgi:murein tripeptide amidase MpaA
MKSLLLSSLLFSSAFAGAVPRADAKVDYSGFKVVRLDLAGKSAKVGAQIEELAAHVLNPGESSVLDVVVAADKVKAVSALASKSTVITNDVGAALEEEGGFSAYAVPSETWFTTYHSYADHIQFLRDLQGAFTTQSEIITSGASVGGRALTGIHIWGSGGKGSKPAVLFHGTVHAREWISTMTVEYMAWQLLTKYSSDTSVKALVDKFDFYIMPIVNPDGFVYTQTNDRLWRKNRQTVSSSSCVGRDINRNWPYKWEVPGGASTNPCSETYKGQAANDAPETKGLVSQVTSLKASRGIRLYIDFHSYGQYILWPYGYDCSLRADNDAAHRTLATNAAAAIRAVSGTTYTIGPSCSTLYATTGDSVDYLDVTGNSTYSYTYELRDTGNNGFTLPASQIQPTVRETWQGVVSMLKAA